jgi:hypothetical protein
VCHIHRDTRIKSNRRARKHIALLTAKPIPRGHRPQRWLQAISIRGIEKESIAKRQEKQRVDALEFHWVVGNAVTQSAASSQYPIIKE